MYINPERGKKNCPFLDRADIQGTGRFCTAAPNVNWGLLQRKCLLLSLCVLDVLSCLSHVRLFEILMDCSPPGSSVHEVLQARILDGLPHLLPGALPNPGIEPTSLMSPVLAGELFTTSTTRKPHVSYRGGSISTKLLALPMPFLLLSKRRENGLPLDKSGRINYAHLAQLPPFTSWKWAHHRTQVWPTSLRTDSAVALTPVQCCHDWVDKPSNSELQNLEA